MNNIQSFQEIIEKYSPIPENIPKVYLLGDTGAGKTSIIRKLMGTDKSKFPSIKQSRTTVATTEYVLCKSLPYKATFIFKNDEQIRGCILEILHGATIKIYNGLEDRKKILETIKQTSDQRFRLYYLLSDEFIENITKDIFNLIPTIKSKVSEIMIALNSETVEIDETDTLLDLAFDDNDIKSEFKAIEDNIFNQIQEKVSDTCNNFQLNSNLKVYQINEENYSIFITKCKSILSSERNSISPVIDYARIQGNLLADWIKEDVELVLIDGEGIGHDTKESGQLSPRHYDYFHQSDAIILVEESKKPFFSSGKNALKNIFDRGYGKKLILIFTKLDEVEPHDVEEPTREDKINKISQDISNVTSALKDDKIDFKIEDDYIFYLSSIDKDELDSDTINEFVKLGNKIKKLSTKVITFVEPEYDYEMLSSFLSDSAKQFIQIYESQLIKQPWQTIKAFNRRMFWGKDDFNMFTPIEDFEEKINAEVKEFISHPIRWKKEVTNRLKLDSINLIKSEFNNLVIKYARQIIITNPQNEWAEALNYSGPRSTNTRKKKIEYIINIAIPKVKYSKQAQKFKDDIKNLLMEAINNCENRYNTLTN